MGDLDQRPRFFEGQYLTAEDLSAVVDYLRGADLRHKLGAHTWGVAIGMNLVERPSPGPANRRDVILQPGYAFDGFGRDIVVDQPLRLAEALFADIAYNPAVDDPAAGGKGRLVKVWITYDEIAARTPARGFETCAEGDVNSRVTQTFRFVVGEVPQLVDRRAPLDIGGRSVDAQLALRAFDPAADLLWDTSVPHQSPLQTPRPPRWLIPLGYVRWIARQNDTGYFVDRNREPSDNADDRIRGFRRYVGVVAEYIESADGAIVLHRRGERPDIQHRFAFLLNGGYKAADLLKDLVWVEGNLRVEGHAKIAGGAVLFRDGNGLDQHTPLYIARAGDNPPSGLDGNRELRAVIGPTAQTNNRFVVGPEQPGASPPAISPHLVVTSAGDVGIGRADPVARLNVVGSRIRLQDTSNDASAKRLDLRTDGAGVDVHSTTHSLYLHASGPATTNNNVVINAKPGDGDGRVGVRVESPAYDLDVKSKSIKLGLEEDGGGQLVLTHNAGDNKIWLEGFSADGQASAAEMLVTGRFGGALPQVHIIANQTIVEDKLGVGTALPEEKLHVAGQFLRVDGNGDKNALFGSDGVFDSVVISSRKAAVDLVELYNLAGAGFMDLHCGTVSELSDARRKTKVEPLASSLDAVTRLRGVSFQWKSDTGRDAGRHIGVIAQEVAGVVPEAVVQTREGAAVSYRALVPVLIEAVKELKAEVDALREKIEGTTRGKR
jgi:hypothetical protein